MAFPRLIHLKVPEFVECFCIFFLYGTLTVPFLSFFGKLDFTIYSLVLGGQEESSASRRWGQCWPQDSMSQAEDCEPRSSKDGALRKGPRALLLQELPRFRRKILPHMISG